MFFPLRIGTGLVRLPVPAAPRWPRDFLRSRGGAVIRGEMAQRIYNFHASDATRESVLLRFAITGPSGSGKTKTALILATRMVERLGLGPVFLIDSENKAALRYAYSPRSRQGYRFKHVAMPEDDYSPAAYTAALDYCEAQGAGVVIIDSLSHAWMGINGVLEQVDQVTDRSRSKNAFSEGWKLMTPVHNRLIQRILSSSAHVIPTLRVRTDWVVQENDRGKKEPMKMGLESVQRQGTDYEWDCQGDMNVPDNHMTISKSRIDRIAPGEVIKRPGVEFADVIIEWMEDAEPSGGYARTLGEALNQAVTEGILAAEEKSADRYKEAKRKLLTWCEVAGVSPARRDVAMSQFKERVAVVAGPKHVAPADPIAMPPALTATDAVASDDVPGGDLPDGAPPPPPPAAPVDAEFLRSVQHMDAAATVEEVRVGAGIVYKRLAQDQSPDGIAFRAAFEANMARFVPGWTIAGAAQAAKDRAAGAAMQTVASPAAPPSAPGASATASPQGGAPAAAQAPGGASAKATPPARSRARGGATSPGSTAPGSATPATK